MDIERFNKQIEFIVEIDKMKQILRNTILMDASRKENSAEHTWHMAVGAMVLSEYSNESSLDMLKVFKMILLHDIVEIDAGDTFAYGNVNLLEIAEKEKKAADRIFGLLPHDQANQLKNIWNEYENAETPEAKFAQAMDSFMPILHNYKTSGLQWQRLGVTREKVLSRNRRIENGSRFLWSFIEGIVNDAVEKGFLKP
ncbi:HD domain-containing protein [Paenibacillus contaminans]|uniref:Hydrolase n=1 Tax=Paenibacillus contaminans TaxID=450362 RepID=A0A329LQV5_9BACL|nr:HD domain-containing protein [Paenibacillus contaminans]RAV10139.1 hydrolase [Paenibacillus contaminans]